MKAFLKTKKPTKYCWSKEQNKTGGGEHYHVALYFDEGMSTTNMSAWRTALLKNCTLEIPDLALVIKHEYCYVRYLGYVTKDEDIIEIYNTTPDELAEGREMEKQRKINMEAHAFMRDTRVIRRGCLELFRVWASKYTGTTATTACDDWLAVQGWVSDEHHANGFAPSVDAQLTFLNQPH